MENQKEEKTAATEIKYVHGDATAPVGDGKKVIVHVCNNIGAWGAGFVLALSKKWKQPEAAYRAMDSYDLGDYEMVKVEDDITICNMIGQENIAGRDRTAMMPPIRYVAIETAFKRIVIHKRIDPTEFSVHMPMIGSGLAGGNWLIIERIIETTLCEAGIPVTVYKFE